MSALHSLGGLITLMALAWLFSENRRQARWQVAVVGVGLQLVLAFLLLKWPVAQSLFAALNDGVIALQKASEAGSSFVFGYLGGAPIPFEETRVGGSFVLAFRALPLVILVSALTALLSYWRVLPALVRGFSFVLERTFSIGGAVGLATAANVFVGMIEAPLFIRDYLEKLTRSELFVVMCTGMATIAGTVLLLYATFLSDVIPDAVGQLLTASLISAPAGVTIALLMVPETGTATAAELAEPYPAYGAMDALATGTRAGLKLFLNIVVMLFVFVALVYLFNAMLGLFPDFAGTPLTLERLLGWIMAPVVWLIGIPWSEATTAGSLMGTKTVLNELLAYTELAALPEGTLSARSNLIMTYALCGFANFGSLGIMIGGLTTLIPERREEIVALGMKSIVGGTLATLCTGAVVGVLIG